MSRRIQPLPVQLANQIAAGEVVERPASVAKELLENSIDAGADEIVLDLEHGGLKLLRVSDNGGGIHPEDLTLALTQHATSKIYSQAELEQITSLGFRGEALASIASVSRFSLCSLYPGEAHGWKISNQGREKAREAQACALEQGTRIDVHELFYNTPARRKFLRSERTEYLHVEEVLKRLALSRYDIAFTLRHNGREIYRLRSAVDTNTRQRRIAQILGQGFMRHAVSLDVAAAGMRLWGWLSPPEYSQAQTGNQYFYLNGRVIRDKLVSHAIRQAHLAALEAGRHPAYVLYLEMDPAQVDINVHPTKHEVRFRQTRLVHDFLQRALVEALQGGEMFAQSGEFTPVECRKEDELDNQTISEERSSYRQSAALRPSMRPQTAIDTRNMLLLFGRYLLRQGEPPGLLDLHALRRQLWLGQLRASLADGELVSVPVLVPELVQLPATRLACLEQQAPALLRLGLIFDSLGPETLVLRQMPRMMQGISPTALLALLLDEPLDMNSRTWQAKLVDGLLSLAPPLSLSPAVDLSRRYETELGKPAPWRQLDEAGLQQWLGQL